MENGTRMLFNVKAQDESQFTVAGLLLTERSSMFSSRARQLLTNSGSSPS